MLFNSFDFLIFFPLVCILYYIIPFRFRHLFLLIASYYFYMCWNPQYALLMLTSTVITYLSGRLIDYANGMKDAKRKEKWRKGFLAGSLILNLSILFFFKYFNFAVDTINAALKAIHVSPVDATLDIILPVGISFYTFQALSYTMDVYRGDIYTEKNFFKYALFVSFFPQLVAGPIERSKNLLKQINVKHSFDIHKIHYGFTRMLYGYFQKVVISDNVAEIVNQIYNHHSKYGAVELIYATVLFAFQIYCDFGGYSNIAIGAAKIMGFDLMENFNAPYLSDSVMDFWRRWHISLSTWFRDYLYIPLGGNRKGRVRKYINLLIVFLVSGLWHGASWHFVAWGGINGLYQVIGDLLKPIRDRACRLLQLDRSTFSHKIAKIVITFILIDFSWIFFRADSIGQAFSIIRKMGSGLNLNALTGLNLFQIGLSFEQTAVVLLSILILLAVDVCRYHGMDLSQRFCKQEVWFQYVGYLVIIFAILLFGYYGPGFDASQFIYFQF